MTKETRWMWKYATEKELYAMHNSMSIRKIHNLGCHTVLSRQEYIGKRKKPHKKYIIKVCPKCLTLSATWY